MNLDLPIIIAIFIVLSFIITYILKKVFKQQTYWVASIVKTKKVIPVFEFFGKRAGKFLDWFSEIGLILGFGPIAVDYLYGRNLSMPKRILLFFGSAAILASLIIGFNSLSGGQFLNSKLISLFALPIIIAFSFGGFAGFTMMLLVASAFDIIVKLIAGKAACPGVAPVIPGVPIPNAPESFVIPLHAWISLILILIIHESFHGITAIKEKIPLKSAGVLLLGFLPVGAFVEPDEKKTLAASGRSQLHLYSAGPTSNLVAMLVLSILIIGLALSFNAVYGPYLLETGEQGVEEVRIAVVEEKIEICGDSYGSPVFGKFEEGMLIRSINDQNINYSGDVLSAIRLGEGQSKFLLEKDGKLIEFVLEPNELGRYGFSPQDVREEGFSFPQQYIDIVTYGSLIFSFLTWFMLLNFLVAIFNFLPLGITDGGRIAKIIFLPYLGFMKMSKKETEKLIGRVFLWIILILIILNALPLLPIFWG